MFFKYMYEMSQADAENAAKLARQGLIRILVPQYHDLHRIHQHSKDAELADFLRIFCTQLHGINDCQQSSDAIKTALTANLPRLTLHPNFSDIQAKVQTCLTAIQNEKACNKDRMRYHAKNQLAKIKNHAIYTACIPSMAVIGGIVLACLYPAGLTFLAIAVAAEILSQIAYWAYHYAPYKDITTKLKNDDFEADKASGTAVDLAELPALPKRRWETVENTAPDAPPEKPPVVISETVDQIMDELSEVVPELLNETATVVSNYASTLWGTVRNAIPGASSGTTIMRNITKSAHLHQL